MPSALPKLTALREECKRQGLNIDLEIDGGINAETAPLAVEAGANVLVAGSFLFSPEMEQRMKYLKNL